MLIIINIKRAIQNIEWLNKFNTSIHVWKCNFEFEKASKGNVWALERWLELESEKA